jgi:hypothetical protein
VKGGRVGTGEAECARFGDGDICRELDLAGHRRIKVGPHAASCRLGLRRTHLLEIRCQTSSRSSIPCCSSLLELHRRPRPRSSIPCCYSLHIDDELPLLKLLHPLHPDGRAKLLNGSSSSIPSSSSSTMSSSCSRSSIPCSNLLIASSTWSSSSIPCSNSSMASSS